MSVVNLRQLDLIVHLETDLAEKLAEMGTVPVDRAGHEGGQFHALAGVQFVSPVVDASSGTRRVRLRLDNESGQHISGVKYRVLLPGATEFSLREP